MDDALEIILNLGDENSTLSKIVALAELGETVIIAREGKPVVRLTLIKPQPTPGLWRDKIDEKSKKGVPTFGLGKGKMPDLGWEPFAPMSDDEAAEWGL